MDLNKVDIFSIAMKKELVANSYKGDWIDSDEWVLLQELYNHVNKLKGALNINNKENILEHSADCANLSMMIADVTSSFKNVSNKCETNREVDEILKFCDDFKTYKDCPIWKKYDTCLNCPFDK